MVNASRRSEDRLREPEELLRRAGLTRPGAGERGDPAPAARGAATGLGVKSPGSLVSVGVPGADPDERRRPDIFISMNMTLPEQQNKAMMGPRAGPTYAILIIFEITPGTRG